MLRLLACGPHPGSEPRRERALGGCVPLALKTLHPMGTGHVSTRRLLPGLRVVLAPCLPVFPLHQWALFPQCGALVLPQLCHHHL